MKKGKKMPAIELEGQSNARFELRDGKIVKVGGEDEGRGLHPDEPRHER